LHLYIISAHTSQYFMDKIKLFRELEINIHSAPLNSSISYFSVLGWDKITLQPSRKM
jgi:hypothetical protein